MEQVECRVPSLREGVRFEPLSGGRTLLYHPKAATQVCDSQLADALKLCNGQPMSEWFRQVRRIVDYTEEEWTAILNQMADFGFFNGLPKRHPRVRLFDPGPEIGRTHV